METIFVLLYGVFLLLYVCIHCFLKLIDLYSYMFAVQGSMCCGARGTSKDTFFSGREVHILSQQDKSLDLLFQAIEGYFSQINQSLQFIVRFTLNIAHYSRAYHNKFLFLFYSGNKISRNVSKILTT